MKTYNIIEKANFVKDCHILLVLEDCQLSKLIKGTFSDIGINVIDIVTNTKDAEKLNNSNHYDIIVIDLVDPVLDIFKFISSVENVKFIVLSRFIEKEYKITSLMAGADMYIQKPVDFIELILGIYELYKEIKNNA